MWKTRKRRNTLDAQSKHSKPTQPSVTGHASALRGPQLSGTVSIGKQKRRITTREGARLQGFPDWFDFVDQAESLTYKQLGNAVNVGAVYNVLRAQVIRDLDLLKFKPELSRAILRSPVNPDEVLMNHKTYFNEVKSSHYEAVKLKIVK